MKISYVKQEHPPFEFTPEQRARLDGMTEAEIEAAALADPENPPLDGARLDALTPSVDARRRARDRGATDHPPPAARARAR